MTDDKNMYVTLVLGLIVLFAFGLLYYTVRHRNKILEGVDGTTSASGPPAVPAPSGTLSSTITAENGKATLTITNLPIKPITDTTISTVFYIYIPEEFKLPPSSSNANLGDHRQLLIEPRSSSSGISYRIDDYISTCDSTTVNDLIFSEVSMALLTKRSSYLNTVKKCTNANKLKIIASHSASSSIIPHSFNIKGFILPVVSPIPISIETDSMVGPLKETVNAVYAAAANPYVAPTPLFTDSNFKIDLSDTTPGTKNVNVKYTFKFTPTTASGFLIERNPADTNDNTVYFIFSDDFDLPPVENVKVAVNDVLLDAGKNEYVLQYKNTCITPSIGSPLFLDSTYKFENDNKICIKIFVLYLKQNIQVPSTGLTISLKGITNPSYSPTPVAYDKKDFLFRAFNTSYCILNLNIKNAGRYLFNPKSDDYIYAGLYMRGNYPLKNTKPVNSESDKSGSGSTHGDTAIRSSTTSVESRGSGPHRAANVYTVNYFYDGQGQGEYGYIARPDIFGTTPYSYGTTRGGLGTSDKYLAKQRRDLEEEKRIREEKIKQWKASQIRPPMGVAPALLNAGVQPYDATINF
jgi:hypothetical protein